MADYEIGKMEQAARKRRERLLAMKKKMKKDANKEKKVIMKKPQVRFRSYKPENDAFKEKQMEKIEAPDITKNIQVHLQMERGTLEVYIDLYKLSPKKLDFDLKRNIKRKLVKLDQITSKAICEMVREKLQQSAKENKKINTREMPKIFDETIDSR